MKKRILSLILILVLLPIASIFSACGKEKNVDLSSLDDEFNSILTENQNMKEVDGTFIFDYSKYEKIESIKTQKPYNQIDVFNFVFSNIMDFSFNHVKVCAVNGLDISKSKKEEIENSLKDLKNSIANTNRSINIFAETVTVAPSDQITSEACLLKFEILLNAYNDVFEDSIYFNNLLSDLYFNNILNNGNPDINSMSVEEFDANLVLSNFQSRLRYQISNLSGLYAKKYIDTTLIKNIVYKNATLNLNEFNYQNDIELIKVKINVDTAKQKIDAQKEIFYKLAVQAQNFQTILENDRNKFIVACKSIDYKTVKDDVTASAFDKMCVEIIDGNHDLVISYNNVLSQMIQILN